MDLISGLPDDLIMLIVRFLSAKDAFTVLRLSRRFRNLYIIIPDLEFDDKAIPKGKFTDHVSEAMAGVKTTTFINRFSLKAAQASRFILQIMQTPLYKKETRGELEHKSQDSSGDSIQPPLNCTEEGLAIRIVLEMLSFKQKKTTAEKAYVAALSKILVLLHLEPSDQNVVKLMKKLLSLLAVSVCSEKEILKEVKPILEHLKPLDACPSEELTQDQANFIFESLGVSYNLEIIATTTVPQTPAPCSTRPAQSIRRARIEEISSDEEEEEVASPSAPNTLMTRSHRASKAVALAKIAASKVKIARINHWLCDVLNRRGVMDLKLSIYGDNGYTLPSEIFTCKTVKKLKLGKKIVISVLPQNALLPVLETLVFKSVRFCNQSDCAFQAFLSACPVLKELTIDGMYWETWEWSGIVSSQSLQRLTIGRILSAGFSAPDHHYQNITFDTPSLVYLKYADFVPHGYTIDNFGSLVEAKLDLLVMVNHQWHAVFANDDDVLSSNATNLIQGIRNVEILYLSSPYTFEMLYFFRDAIPVFEKLRHLTMIQDDGGFCWRFLPFLLEKTPNLKTLL